MSDMDINKIFGTFNSDRDENGFPTPKFIKDMEENHPRYYLGMFSKLINNHLSYQKGLIQMFQSADPKLNMKDIEAAGEHLLYNRAWDYISQFNPEDKYCLEILQKESTFKLQDALNLSIKHFEKDEEYEKCAFLKKLLDSSKFSS